MEYLRSIGSYVSGPYMVTSRLHCPPGAYFLYEKLQAQDSPLQIYHRTLKQLPFVDCPFQEGLGEGMIYVFNGKRVKAWGLGCDASTWF